MVKVTRYFNPDWRWRTFLVGASYDSGGGISKVAIHLGFLSLHWIWGTYEV